MSKTINAYGLAEIAAFLAAKHKLGGEHFTPDMLRAWAADAEFQLAEGNSATVEIRASDTVSGHAETYTVSDEGIDSVDDIRVAAIEDNAGGLHIAVIRDGACTHFFSGFEHGGDCAPSMQEEIESAATEGVRGWDGNAEDPQASYDYFLAHEYGYKIIGEWEDGEVVVYTDAMGNAGHRWSRTSYDD